jgi:hypothetical protein
VVGRARIIARRIARAPIGDPGERVVAFVEVAAARATARPFARHLEPRGGRAYECSISPCADELIGHSALAARHRARPARDGTREQEQHGSSHRAEQAATAHAPLQSQYTSLPLTLQPSRLQSRFFTHFICGAHFISLLASSLHEWLSTGRQISPSRANDMSQ